MSDDKQINSGAIAEALKGKRFIDEQLVALMRLQDRQQAQQQAGEQHAREVERHVREQLRAKAIAAGALAQMGRTLAKIESLNTHAQQQAEQHARELEIVKDIAVRAASAGGGGTPAKRSMGKTYAQGWDEYFDPNRGGALGFNTAKTYRPRVKHGEIFFGADTDIGHIGQSGLSEYANHVVADETIKAVGTKREYISNVRTFLNWHRSRADDFAPLSTASGIAPRNETPEDEQRDPFTLDELKAVFENARQYLQAGKSAAGRKRIAQPRKYWVTLAAALTGCRIEELCQINLHADLHYDEGLGVWFFDLNPKPDSDGIVRKRFKNDTSHRCVPIHSALVAHGFIDYLKAQKDAGHSRPFESHELPRWNPLIQDDGKHYTWSHGPSTQWGPDELKALSFSPEHDLSYFHSMRHSFAGSLVNADVTIEKREAVMGHKKETKSQQTRYAKLKKNVAILSRHVIEPGLDEIVKALKDAWGGELPKIEAVAPPIAPPQSRNTTNVKKPGRPARAKAAKPATA